jgi:hypothetical protein
MSGAHSAQGRPKPLSFISISLLEKIRKNYAHYAHSLSSLWLSREQRGPAGREWSRGIGLPPGRSCRGIP